MALLGSSLMQWLAVAVIGLFATILAAFLRDRAHRLREAALKTAVRQRTEELECERHRQTERNRILEMLVSNQSLGTVLDAVVQAVRGELPQVNCAILLKRADTWHIGAAPELPKDWLAALHPPHTVPFEVWREPCFFRSPVLDPAWRVFTGRLTSPGPAVIRTHPIGGADLALGAILIFESEATPDWPAEERGTETLESAVRLAQVAIEHSRFYDDLHFQAHHDSLTGLPNRALFDERLNRTLCDSKDTGRKLAILFVDLDRFKQINDTLSHRVGDILLSEVARRMKRVVRPIDTVARIGGDEFNVLIPDIAGPEDAEEAASRILATIREPMFLEGRPLTISASMGIAIFPDDGTEPEELQREADAAMYCAKGLGRDRIQAFSTRNATLDRARLEQEVRLALRQNLFCVHYQPKIGADGRFGGLEALLRLTLPVHGAISPAEFIPVAEESGLIIPLGAWVLNEVCAQIVRWREEGLGDVSVAVNVSPIQISRSDFSQGMRDCLERHGVSPANVELELTESLLIGGGEEAQKQMRELRSIGVQFSIDDFGTGYSSLSYLHRLQVDAIKLDRSFVQSVDSDEAARRLVQAMIGVAQGLGLNIIAEGVETEAQRATLISAGCPMMQGFLFARPQPACEITQFLRGHASGLDDLLRLEGAVDPVVETEPMLHPV